VVEAEGRPAGITQVLTRGQVPDQERAQYGAQRDRDQHQRRREGEPVLEEQSGPPGT
jgi:hypothetical protein